MGETIILFMIMQMPFNTPIMLEDEQRYKTHKECNISGQKKAREIAQEMADNIGAPIGFRFWCEGEERTET